MPIKLRTEEMENERRDRREENYTDLFIEEAKMANLSKSTIKSYIYSLSKIKTSIPINLEELKGTVKVALSTPYIGVYNKRLQCYRRFYEFLIDKDMATENYAKKFKYKKTSYKYYQTEATAIAKFLKSFDKSFYSQFRDYIFCVLMLDTGIRPTEALDIVVGNINFNSKEIYLPAKITKTRTPRILPISTQTTALLKKLIEIRPEEWGLAPVFCTIKGGKMVSHSLQDNFSKYSRQAGVKITPYQLRHFFATTYIREGGNLFILKEILGHTSIKTTQIYVNLDKEDIKKNHLQTNVLKEFVPKRVYKIEDMINSTT